MIRTIWKWLFEVPPEPDTGVYMKDEFLRAPINRKWADNSTKQHHWCFPPNRPYQIYDGPIAPDRKEQVWTSRSELPGYKLTEDYYSDRLYHVWSGE